MAEKWRYRADGKDHGPFSVEEMKERAARGDLGPEDLVWPEGSSPEDGMPAEQAIDFSTLASAVPAALPDWLADVQTAAEEAAHRPESPPTNAIPAWLQELLSEQGAEAPAESPPAREEEAAPIPEPSSEEVEAEAAALFLFEPPEEEAPPATSEAEVEANEIAVEPAPPPKSPETLRRWTETAQEAWHRARVTLDRWIDLDCNRDLVLAGDVEALQQDPDVRELIEPLQRFGTVLVDHLIQHLAFLAENRRKYYVAISKKPGAS